MLVQAQLSKSEREELGEVFWQALSQCATTSQPAGPIDWSCLELLPVLEDFAQRHGYAVEEILEDGLQVALGQGMEYAY